MINMVKWRTRTRGSARQRGKHFPTIPKGDKHNLPKALKAVSVSPSQIRTSCSNLPEQSTKERFTEEEIIEAGKEELREAGIEFEDNGDEVRIPVLRRTKKSEEDKPLEYDWWEAQRRKSALRRNKVIIR